MLFTLIIGLNSLSHNRLTTLCDLVKHSVLRRSLTCFVICKSDCYLMSLNSGEPDLF